MNETIPTISFREGKIIVEKDCNELISEEKNSKREDSKINYED